MAHPQLAAFARLADGGARPVRSVAGQKTLLARTHHAIVYDPIHDEIVLPQNIGQAILTFRGGANGEEAPIRMIQGPKTQLIAPNRVEVDAVHNEIFVPEDDHVLVFPREANGDVAPLRILRGPDTRLGADAVAVDPVHNLLIVSGAVRVGRERVTSLLLFNRTDEGNVKPKAVISGPRTGLVGTGLIQVYPPAGKILVTVRGTGNQLVSDDGFVGVWNLADQGDVPPRWTIGGPKGMLQQVRGVALDPKHKSVIISDKRLNAVLTYYFPELF